MSMDPEDFKVPSEKKIKLKILEPAWIPKWAEKKEDEEGKKSDKRAGISYS